MTWAQVSARLGRNDLPEALATAVNNDVLTEAEEIAKGVRDAWTQAEWPMRILSRDVWMWLFDRALPLGGYLFNTEARDHAELPETTVLYRGAIAEHRDGMSWTDDIERADWFATRMAPLFAGKPGHIYELVVPRAFVLARFPDGRNEGEWVVDTSFMLEDDLRVVHP